MLEASILVIGDEILGGFVRDTNSGWLAQRLRDHGVPLIWVHTLPDDLDAIGDALQTELGRGRPRVIFTSGGIGSTPDDLTYEAVAASLDRDLVEEPLIARRIEGALEWTREQGMEVTEGFAWHMLRMARVPRGAELIRHRGWAPGIRVDVDGGIDVGGATIVVLPGVPAQLRAIVSEAVEPALLAGRNRPAAVAELTHAFPESVLNVCFAEVLERYPEVKIGSYPGMPMTVRVTGPPEQVQPAMGRIRAFVEDLQRNPVGERLARAWAERLMEPDANR